jgi:cysteine desulfurase/selenocysteine lyase
MHGKPLIYLDSAATAHKPLAVIDSLDGFYRDHYATVLRAIYELANFANNAYQQARVKVQQFINAPVPEEIVFTRSTTDAINIVAYSYGKAFVRPGDTVMITEMEHHSNLVPWQILCEDRGAKLIVAPFDDAGNLLLDRFEALIKEYKPKIIAVTHVSNVLGTLNPIKQLASIAHAHGAHILVDGAQSISHLPVDVQDLDVDFYAFSGHKLYGPNGVGILYGKADLLNEMPPAQGGGSMVEKVTFEKTTYNVLPWKFEAGTMMLAEIISLGAAIDYLQQYTMPKIHAWEQYLISYAMERIQEVDGLTVIGNPKKRESVISFTVEGVHPLDIGSMLDLKGIAIRTGHNCAQTLLQHYNLTTTARISFGIYNTPQEIDFFVDSLQATLAMLR